MVNLILIIMLTVMLFLVYIAFDYSFVNISFLMIIGFLVSSMFSLFNLKEWGAYVGMTTVFVILSGIFVFFIGDYLGQHLKEVRTVQRRTYNKIEITTDLVIVNLKVTAFISVFMAVVDYYYFRFIYNLSLRAGNHLGIAGMFQYARYLIVDGTYDSSTPRLLGHSIIICECLGYIYLFIVIYNIIGKKKILTANWIPCILYILNAAISTSRFNFMKYFIAGVVLALVILIKKNVRFKRIRLKTIASAVLTFAVLMWGFRMLGYLTGKSAVRYVWSDISVYIGSSIPALDTYLTSPKIPNEIFGKETLANVYTLLRKLKMTSVQPYSIPLPFVKFASGNNTNIYTAFRRLIQDYDYIGMYIILLFEGVFYGAFTKKVLQHEEIGLSTILFAYMAYPAVFSCIEEKFIVNFTAINLVYHLIYFILLYKLIIKTPHIMGG